MPVNWKSAAAPGPFPRQFWPVVLIYLGLLVATRCQYWGDTHVYVDQIIDTAHGNAPAAELWDFGHPLWRPLAFSLFRHMPLSWFGGEERVTATLSFVVPGVIGGLLAAVGLFGLARSVSRRFWVPLLAACFLLCCNGFLNQFQVGTSYIAGLGGLSLALWLILEGDGRWLHAAGAGFCLAAAILVWFPYCLVAPAAALCVFLPQGELLFWKQPGWTRRVLFAAIVTFVTLLVTGAAYAWAIHAHGFHTAAEIREWVAGSSHGWNQNRNFVRFLFGLPRGFLDMGHDGILFKRYLFKDPYAGVTLVQLLRVSLLKLALFYVLLAYFLLRLATIRSGRLLLAVFVVASLPLFYFAIFLFEPGSPERYLPLFPFLALVIAFVLDHETWPAVRGLVAASLLAVSLAGIVQSRIATHRLDEVAVRRVTALKGGLAPGSVLWVLTTLEDVYTFAINRPFHPLNRPHPLPVDDVIFAGSDRQRLWREDFAATTLRAFNANAPVWLSSRLLAPRPEADWNWTEGDSPYVHWKDLPAFFSRLDFAEKSGGSDGFIRIADTTANRSLLSHLVSATASSGEK